MESAIMIANGILDGSLTVRDFIILMSGYSVFSVIVAFFVARIVLSLLDQLVDWVEYVLGMVAMPAGFAKYNKFLDVVTGVIMFLFVCVTVVMILLMFRLGLSVWFFPLPVLSGFVYLFACRKVYNYMLRLRPLEYHVGLAKWQYDNDESSPFYQKEDRLNEVLSRLEVKFGTAAT